MTLIFQDGHLAGLFGDATGPIESFLPIMVFAVVFGLSMDYEVFLVSRMHEEWVHTRDAHYAVRHGLAMTGRVVTAAAIIMIAVFGAFAIGNERALAMMGVGFAAAIFIDAFIIRLLLLPGGDAPRRTGDVVDAGVARASACRTCNIEPPDDDDRAAVARRARSASASRNPCPAERPAVAPPRRVWDETPGGRFHAEQVLDRGRRRRSARGFSISVST